jgi:hypothetical protein
MSTPTGVDELNRVQHCVLQQKVLAYLTTILGCQKEQRFF